MVVKTQEEADKELAKKEEVKEIETKKVIKKVEKKIDLYEERIVILKPIKRDNWSGHTRYPKCKDMINVQQGRGGFHTGLKKDEQTFLEKELGYEEGTLSPNSKFWIEYAFAVYGLEVELNLSNPRDILDYRVCMNSKRVANSITTIDEWPKAEYVLYDAEEDAKKDNVAVKERRTAFAKFGKMTTSEMKDVLKLMGRRADNLSLNVIENQIDTIIQEDPKSFNDILKLPNFKTRVLIEDLLGVNAIRKSGTHFKVGDDVIGHDLESTIIYLEDPKNQNLLISLKNKLEARK